MEEVVRICRKSTNYWGKIIDKKMSDVPHEKLTYCISLLTTVPRNPCDRLTG